MGEQTPAGEPSPGTGPVPTLRSICVYCGSSPGDMPIYEAVAAELGSAMASAGIALVYGGGDIGLMGTVARSVLAGGGQVTGIIPDFLRRREQMLGGTQDLIVVQDMHTRKQLMFEKADAFVALPGGIGTLEELVEQMTWSQLGRHTKPILLLNVAGFWSPLLDLLSHMRQHGFIRPGLEFSYLVAEEPRDVLPLLTEALRETSASRREGIEVDRL